MPLTGEAKKAWDRKYYAEKKAKKIAASITSNGKEKITIEKFYSLLKEKTKKVLNKLTVNDIEISKLSQLSPSQIFYIKNVRQQCVSQKVAEKISAFLQIPLDNFDYKTFKYKFDTGKKELKTAGKFTYVTALNFMVRG